MIKKTIIAVIDSGINDSKLNCTIERYVAINGSAVSVDESDFEIDTHGTICAMIIDKYVSNLHIVSVRVLDDEWTGRTNDLCAAIKWCVDNGIKLINISVGTVLALDFNVVTKACNYAYDNGVIIVAAQNNRGRYALPACLPNVISVQSIFPWRKRRELDVFTDIYAPGRHKIANRVYSDECNSYACAYACALIANILKNDSTINKMKVLSELNRRTRVRINNNRLTAMHSLSYISSLYYVDELENFFPTKSTITLVPYNKCPKREKNIDVLLISARKQFMEILKEIDTNNNIRSLLICGNASDEITDYCRNRKINMWDYSFVSCRRKMRAPATACPIIRVLGNSVFVKETLSALNQSFTNEGYRVCTMSDVEYAFLDAYYYYNKKTLINTLQYVSFLSPDIIFWGDSKSDVNSKSDIIIQAERDKFTLKHSNEIYVCGNVFEIIQEIHRIYD